MMRAITAALMLFSLTAGTLAALKTADLIDQANQVMADAMELSRG